MATLVVKEEEALMWDLPDAMDHMVDQFGEWESARLEQIRLGSNQAARRQGTRGVGFTPRR